MTSVQPDWETFHKMGTSQKIPYFSKDNRLYDCLFAQQLNRELLEHLFRTADTLRSVTRTKDGADHVSSLLSDKRAMLYFAQPSTRTFMSFLNAAHVLGIKTSEIRDTSTSSEVKGENARRHGAHFLQLRGHDNHAPPRPRLRGEDRLAHEPHRPPRAHR